ncbi:hypothetical protein DXG03_008218, partial [Asterophora parasitica]
MTEYDFSPEAYQAHLANMERISRWVDRTEDHRPEFANAAALTQEQRKPSRRSSLSGQRRAPPPPPLHLPPYGANPGYVMGMGTGRYPSPQHSSGMYSGGDFAYASGPGSPGPMPPNMQHIFAPPLPIPGPSPFYPVGAQQPGYVIIQPAPTRRPRRHSRKPSVSYV